jgi:hypothetical protein
MSVEPIYERFHTANSLQTLVRLFGPLAVPEMSGPIGHSSESSLEILMLYNLLQVLAWVMAGYVVSALLYWLRVGRWRGWRAALSLGPGILLIWAGYVAVPSWLQVEGPRWLHPLWLPAQIVLAGFVAWGLDGLAQYLRQPVITRHRSARVSASSSFPSHRGGSPSGDRRLRATQQQIARDRESRAPLELLKLRPKPKARDEEDIIMIELD